MGKRWTKQEEQYILDHFLDRTMTKDEFVNYIDRSWGAIYNRANRLGLNREHYIEPQKYHDKEWLYDQYHNKKKTFVQIAKECNVSSACIVKYMKKNGIKATRAVRHKIPSYSVIYDLYIVEKLSIREISKQLNVGYGSVERWIEYHSIPKRSWSEARKVYIHEKGGLKLIIETNIKTAKGKDFAKKISATKQGIDFDDWEGFVTTKIHKIRTSSKYKEWRKSVYKRDHFTCQDCGQVGKDLNAHHLKHMSGILKDYNISLEYEDIMNNIKDSEIFDINNGVTLCIGCHYKYHPSVGYLISANKKQKPRKSKKLKLSRKKRS